MHQLVHFVVGEGDEGDAVLRLHIQVGVFLQLGRVLPLHRPKTLFTYNLRPHPTLPYIG
jgi:hypothetical protein